MLYKIKRGDTWSKALHLREVMDRTRDRLGTSKLGDVVALTIKAVEAPPTNREQMIAQARWMIDHEPSIHYNQARPIPQYDSRHLPMSLDCSGAYISLCRWAGIDSPTASYTSGSTDTLLAKMRPIAKNAALPGDVVLYHLGADGKHVAMFLEPGSASDPLLFSHGIEAGPLAVRLAKENSYHSSETASFLRLEG
jgi:NlpC/P60 family